MEREETKTYSKHWKFRPSSEFFEPPGPLAENLAPEIALTGLRAYMTRRKPAGLFHSAWAHIEYAMNQNHPSFDAQLRQKYFGDASYLLGQIINKNDQAGEDLFLRALTLNSFLPAFSKRAIQQPITSRDCHDAYQSLGAALQYHEKHADPLTRSWRFAETITHAAAARSRQPELLFWPTSPREEASDRQRNNHDGYFIHKDVKIPGQLKLIETEREYDEPIIVIYLLPILDHACMRAGLSKSLDFGQSLDFAAEAIIAETTQQEIQPQQLRFLDYFSRSIAARSRYSELQKIA
jgi:hypothetical protein